MPLAVTFDWFGTLAHHQKGVGRGRQFGTYLASKGLNAHPWDRRILYKVFEYYGDAYQPKFSDQEKRLFWAEFTRLLFEQAKVRCMPNEIDGHADAIRGIFGSSSFELYAEVTRVLSGLKTQGMRLGLISNWQRGLNHLCEELNIASYFDAIISSAEVGYEKPDPRIFKEALKQLRVSPEDTVHVGDSIDDDFRGATNAGLRAVLVDRHRLQSQLSESPVHDLNELERIIN